MLCFDRLKHTNNVWNNATLEYYNTVRLKTYGYLCIKWMTVHHKELLLWWGPLNYCSLYPLAYGQCPRWDSISCMAVPFDYVCVLIFHKDTAILIRNQILYLPFPVYVNISTSLISLNIHRILIFSHSLIW